MLQVVQAAVCSQKHTKQRKTVWHIVQLLNDTLVVDIVTIGFRSVKFLS
jgi:hypothetical protein